MKHGQPYLGTFLLKDENTDISSVHEVGVSAQITSVFAAVGRGEDDREEGLTAVLYPHRRIKITELVKPGPAKPPQVQLQSVEPPTPPPSPSPDRRVVEKSGTFARLSNLFLSHSKLTTMVQGGTAVTASQYKRLSCTNTISHLSTITLPYSKDDQYIRAFMSEIVSVFKDIAQLKPLFRDQITNFSINQVAANVFDEPDKTRRFCSCRYPSMKFKNFKMFLNPSLSMTVSERLSSS